MKNGRGVYPRLREDKAETDAVAAVQPARKRQKSCKSKNLQRISQGVCGYARIIFLASMMLGFARAQTCTNSAVCPAGTRGALLYMNAHHHPAARASHRPRRPIARSADSPTADKILLSLPQFYHRFPNETVDASRIPLLSVTECKADYGPGSKILCAVGQLATLLASPPLGRQAFAVICDDDRFYQPSALALLEAAILRDPSAAFSFYTYDLPQTPLRVGQGADILAFDARHVLARASTAIVAGGKGNIDLVAPGVAAEGMDVGQSENSSKMASVRHTAMLHFYSLACRVNGHFRLHDDVWIAMYLQDMRGLAIANVLPNNTLPAVGTELGPWQDWDTALWKMSVALAQSTYKAHALTHTALPPLNAHCCTLREACVAVCAAGL